MSLIDTITRRLPLKSVADTTNFDRDLAKLSTRRAELTAKYDSAAKKLAEAKDGRRHSLVNDPDADADKLSRTVRDAEDQAQMFAEALSDIDRQIASLAEQRDAHALQAKREQAAGSFDATADAFAGAAAEFEKAAVTFAKAFRKLEKSVPDDFGLIEIRSPDRNRKYGPATGTELASIVLAEALHKAMPGAFVHAQRTQSLLRYNNISGTPSPTIWDGPSPAMSASEAASKLLVDRARKHADAIRAGDVDLHTDRRVERQPEPESEAVTQSIVRVFTTKDFRFVNDGVAWELCSHNTAQSVPVPVAEAAVKAGVALRTDTPEGMEAWTEHERNRRTALPFYRGPLYFDDCFDLGDPCDFAKGAEVPRPRGLAVAA